ncbi:hypothetical protein [Natronosalvus amylolyticus]|uniref:hypothetical protein n=1 Tax=Natronosalvus amylolyticus TaxID=2961994 RepID=UPI0020C9E6B5|nr:hypothetical protein [Natronosalvus amylolyticus]
MNEHRSLATDCSDEQFDEPSYAYPYSTDSRVYQSKRQTGYYGVMYAPEYEWDVVRCTAEAYGDSRHNTHSAIHQRVIDGRPRRSTAYHTGWLSVDVAKACIRVINQYNYFDADAVCDALEALPDGSRVVVGREGSPVVYVWTDCAPYVMGVLDDARPSELGAHLEADTYPTQMMGATIGQTVPGKRYVVRAWWD